MIYFRLRPLYFGICLSRIESLHKLFFHRQSCFKSIIWFTDATHKSSYAVFLRLLTLNILIFGNFAPWVIILIEVKLGVESAVNVDWLSVFMRLLILIVYTWPAVWKRLSAYWAISMLYLSHKLNTFDWAWLFKTDLFVRNILRYHFSFFMVLSDCLRKVTFAIKQRLSWAWFLFFLRLLSFM